MINITYMREGGDVVLYLKDRVVYGKYVSADWGVIALKDNVIVYSDGKNFSNTDMEYINIADVIAVGYTGTMRHKKRAELCWQLSLLDYEINFENKHKKYK